MFKMAGRHSTVHKPWIHEVSRAPSLLPSKRFHITKIKYLSFWTRVWMHKSILANCSLLCSICGKTETYCQCKGGCHKFLHCTKAFTEIGNLGPYHVFSLSLYQLFIAVQWADGLSSSCTKAFLLFVRFSLSANKLRIAVWGEEHAIVCFNNLLIEDSVNIRCTSK